MGRSSFSGRVDSASFHITAFLPRDYGDVVALWRRTEGMHLRDADSREGIERFLARNPGLSLIARASDATLLGVVLVGHDGRRGLLHHLAVASEARRRGVGRALALRAIDALEREGIRKTMLFVKVENAGGRAFWESLGFTLRGDVDFFSRAAEGAPNA